RISAILDGDELGANVYQFLLLLDCIFKRASARYVARLRCANSGGLELRGGGSENRLRGPKFLQNPQRSYGSESWDHPQCKPVECLLLGKHGSCHVEYVLAKTATSQQSGTGYYRSFSLR